MLFRSGRWSSHSGLLPWVLELPADEGPLWQSVRGRDGALCFEFTASDRDGGNLRRTRVVVDLCGVRLGMVSRSECKNPVRSLNSPRSFGSPPLGSWFAAGVSTVRFPVPCGCRHWTWRRMVRPNGRRLRVAALGWSGGCEASEGRPALQIRLGTLRLRFSRKPSWEDRHVELAGDGSKWTVQSGQGSTPAKCKLEVGGVIDRQGMLTGE